MIIYFNSILMLKMSDPQPIREGWVGISNSRKFHYVEKNTTLCGKFLYLGSAFSGLWTGSFTKDDCSKCVAVLQKRDAEKK